MIERAIFGTAQAAESIAEDCDLRAPIAVEASFDEFNLDVRLAYAGEPFVLEAHRPTDDEIRDADDGIRRPAGFLLQSNADRARTSAKGDRHVLEFHYQH